LNRFQIGRQSPGIHTTRMSAGSDAAMIPPGKSCNSISIPSESEFSLATPSTNPAARSLIVNEKPSIPRLAGFRVWTTKPLERRVLRASSLIAAASIVERTGWRCNATLEGCRSARSVDGAAVFVVRAAPAQIHRLGESARPSNEGSCLVRPESSRSTYPQCHLSCARAPYTRVRQTVPSPPWTGGGI
jgi:hypothetical protein